MKKLISLLLWTMFLCAVGISASAVQQDMIADTSATADVRSTGVTAADLGDSFYARISLDDPEKYFTIPDDVMRTTSLKAYADSSTQFWHFTRQNDGSYKIRSVYANLYLELYNDQPRENNEVFHTDEDNLPDQRWILQKSGDGYQIITCCDTSFMLKGINLYGNHAEVVISKDSFRDTTRFKITKLPYKSDYLSTPVVTLTNTLSGVEVKWNKVAYAQSYRVYRYQASSKKWVTLSATADTQYTDKNVSGGVTYQYAVRAVGVLQSNIKACSIRYITAPVVKVNNTADGPVISWKKSAGADAYRVFYKTTGSWKTLATVKTNTYTHKKATFNVNYTYTVRCVTADGKQFTSAVTSGVKNRIVKTPKVSVTLTPNGYQLNWDKITGAYHYKVMIKSKATNWTWSKSINCIYNNYFYGEPLNNETYYFTVRCTDQSNQYISGYTVTKKFVYYSAPRVKKFVSTAKANTLTWNAVKGAAKYRVYSWNGKKWVKRSDTKATTLKIPVQGSKKQNTCFAVRCLDKNGKEISSYFETILNGKKIQAFYPKGYTASHRF